ncbi:hypothetical protein GCM10011506_33170 [Marivirga lumbricoides]|uniref:Outer membrane protein beta-barrel domain-containing protein n=1 Tax=Marivirga lumbricoides TaxID=1046115 RepID=A0A2T4DV40_9BACT|nr:hypothetical protein C9994_01845 [Marivirga lumbricoides]GGC44937.1 hypothetical protein GCM10011506_33170 [Marivirga lumbricoides]
MFLRKFLLVISILLVWLINQSQAQVEINLSGAIEIPLDELSWIYNPGKSAQLAVSFLDEYKKRRSSWGINIGYSVATPKQEVFYFPYSIDNEVFFGTISYSDMQSFQLSSNFRSDFILSKHIEFFLGAEVGYHYISSSYDSDSYNDVSATSIIGRVAISPKTGFAFMLTDNIGLNLQTRYNISIIAGGEVDDSKIVSFFWSNGAGVTLRF